MSLFYAAHSGVRYLVLLFGLIALFQALWASSRRRTYDPRGRLLLVVYTGTLDLQVLLGLLTLLTRPFYSALIGHIVMMLGAAVVVHITLALNRRREPSPRGYALQMVGVALSLVLIVAGILAIGRPIIGSNIDMAA